MTKVLKYKEFLVESNIPQFISDNIDDEYVKNIVTRYTKDIDTGIDIFNAILLLDKRTQEEIASQVKKYLERGIVEKDPQIIASTELGSLLESQEVSVVGKGVFTSFLKVLTALGKKENSPNWDITPEDFLIYYQFNELQVEDVKSIFMRFKSLSRFVSKIPYDLNQIGLYFGIKTNGDFEYGLRLESNLPIGQFKLTKSAINWILSVESKSAQSLKKEVVNLLPIDILTLGQIKVDMKGFNPGYHEKRLMPEVRDKVISFGYYGIGKWDNGVLDEGELMNVKNNFTTFLLSKKWGQKVLISVKAKSFWTYLHIKLK